MNFYKHFIGDFQRDTGHLCLTERGAYLALMHHYYATEQALPVDHAALCRIASAFSKPERDAVKVAMKFFEVRDGALWHKRIEAELEKSEGRSDTNRRIALDREARKRAEKVAQDDHEACTTRGLNVAGTLHEQSTPQNHSHSLLRKEGESPRKRVPPLVIDGVSETLMADYLVVRKAKKVGALTETAVVGIQREASKAGLSMVAAIEACCQFGWATFNAGWYAERTATSRASQLPTGETAYQRNARLRVAEFSPMAARKAPGLTPFDFIDEVKNVVAITGH